MNACRIMAGPPDAGSPFPADAEQRRSFLDDLAASRTAGERFDAFVRRRKATVPAVIGFGIYYRGYRTSDGALVVECLSPSSRERMRAALGIEDPLEGSSARSVPAAIITEIEGMFTRRSTDEWMALFDRFGVPASPVWFVEEMLEDPQVVENEYALELEHDLAGPQWVAAPPLKMSDSPPIARRASPPLGRDTRRWLQELGYSNEAIADLASSGAARLDPRAALPGADSPAPGE